MDKISEISLFHIEYTEVNTIQITTGMTASGDVSGNRAQNFILNEREQLIVMDLDSFAFLFPSHRSIVTICIRLK